jgi:DNA-binding XRE family transcriptional regulator
MAGRSRVDSEVGREIGSQVGLTLTVSSFFHLRGMPPTLHASSQIVFWSVLECYRVTPTTRASESAIWVQVTNGDKAQSPSKSAPNVWYNLLVANEMSERDEVTPFNRQRGLDWNPGSAPGMDRMGDPTPGPVPRGSLAIELARRLALPPVEPRPVPMPVPGPSPDESLRRAAALSRAIQGLSPGQRIRNLRLVLGWTQRTAATELGISVRTLIRHEQGHHRTPWLRLPLLRRLCQMEREHADQIIAYHDYRGPERA